MDRPREATANLNESMGVLIIDLKYDALGEDGKLPSGGLIEAGGFLQTGTSEENYCTCGYGYCSHIPASLLRRADRSHDGLLQASDPGDAHPGEQSKDYDYFNRQPAYRASGDTRW
ncbi:hypothetical protein PQR65_03780 [Paraburkholderia nemoris]|uniref:hypothetical protein n=1 Tax=Paraburkholderia nemoris TaxID=2793076 RepID=UPI0038B802BB